MKWAFYYNGTLRVRKKFLFWPMTSYLDKITYFLEYVWVTEKLVKGKWEVQEMSKHKKSLDFGKLN